MSAATGDTTTGNARYVQRGLLDRWRAHPAGNVIIVFLTALALCVVAGLMFPDDFRFLSVGNISILTRAIPILGIMALGVGILMIAGEYDLSIGAVFGFSSYMMVWAYVLLKPVVDGSGVGLGALVLACVLLAFLIGAAIGFINGWITLTFGIPSFITTLGTLFIIRSSGRMVSGNIPKSFFPPDWFQQALTMRLFGYVQAQFVWFILLAIFTWYLLNRHWLGNHFLAVGGNRNSAKQVGIDVNRTKMMAFVLCSMFAVFASILSVTRGNQGTTEAQSFMELEAVAACVLGGVALTGGRGSVIGIFVGACMFHLVRDVMLLAHMPTYFLDFFVGIAIVFGVSLNQLAKKKY